MTVSAIILSHYKERENNLKRIVDDLTKGTIVPKICVFIDNPDINFRDDRVTIIRSDQSFLPRIRFSLGTYLDTDYTLFIDDDLTVREKTIENLLNYAEQLPINSILGLQGSILGDTNTPYANDISIKRGQTNLIEVDVVLRTYFVSRLAMHCGSLIQALNPSLPDISLDDIYLCLGNKYLNQGKNYVVPVDDTSNVYELSEFGVGQSFSGEHYQNRNEVTRYLMDKYAK